MPATPSKWVENGVLQWNTIRVKAGKIVDNAKFVVNRIKNALTELEV